MTEGLDNHFAVPEGMTDENIPSSGIRLPSKYDTTNRIRESGFHSSHRRWPSFLHIIVTRNVRNQPVSHVIET